MSVRLGHMPNGTGEKYAGTARVGAEGRPVFTGIIRLDPAALETPRQWRSPRIIFVNSMSDLFHRAIPDRFIQSVFRVMKDCGWHTFQVLTKRPERVLELSRKLEWSPNIWLGTSVETASYFDRIRLLQRLRSPAVRFLSCEPLLGPLNRLPLKGIDWVIVGGESGPKARPVKAEWVEKIRLQCVQKGVRFFFKQWGGTNKKAAGRRLGGRTWDQMPRVHRITVGGP